ncbi:MAG TPA: prolyl oligopeptidase family serine peptidase [Terriglobia bacterium]|nr:prolyl oligopeptidase family serine peptidase [Terriglobia bacterium]
MRRAFSAVIIIVVLVCVPLMAQKLQYPNTRRVDHVDTYFGVKVEDPYRWLEDDNAPETMKWVEAENKVTFGYLDKIPYRKQIKARLEKLFNYPRYGAPFRNGQHFFFAKNDGLQNQSVFYMQKGLEGTPELLIDPNKFSADSTSQLAEFALSKDGKYFAYGISQGGSDWRDVHVMEIEGRRTLSDLLKWVKVSDLAWQGNGFYYSRYDAPAEGKELTSSNDDHKVYYHHIGSPQAQDELVYEDKANPQRFHQVQTTEDERFAILYISDRGKGKEGEALFVRDNAKTDKKWIPLIPEIGDDHYYAIDNIGDKFLIQTNRKTPNWKVVLVDPKNPEEKNWQVVLPEKAEPLETVGTAGGKLFASYLKDVTTRAYVYDLTGKLENEITLPGLGTASGFAGKHDDKFIFYTFQSFNVPPSIYRYDIATRKSTLFRMPEIPDFKSTDYETKQVFFTSKDGTRVPMFLVHKKGLKLDGKNPTLLYGYGGFSNTIPPSFSPLRLALLEQGVLYASANIRGGAEYGEKWHEAGTKLKKQNVFDDFIAAAGYLIANKYTSSERLAVQGASNGGLLVGALANQRPDLVKVVIQQAGVMDMLRFHKFTIGWNWVADYGSSDNEAEFKVLRAYSPIHNIKEAAKYPATFITTADHDDRVVPAHSFKYAAALQHGQGGDHPVLIRIDTNSGHGASNTAKSIEQTADIDSFLLWNLGVTPKY